MPAKDHPELTDKDVTNKLNDLEKEYKSTEEAKEFEGFEQLPEGDYIFGVENYKWIESENANVGLCLTLIPISPTGFVRYKVWHTFWLTKANLPYLKRDFKIITGRTIETLGSLRQTDWMRVEFKAHCSPETWQNKTYTRIKWFIARTEQDGLNIKIDDEGNEEEAQKDLPF